jgi:hypothetical protein
MFSEGGREDEAAELLELGTDRAFGDLTRDPSYITCIAYYSESAIRLRHERSAAVLHALVAPLAGQVGFDGVATVGSLHHHLGGLAGLLGHHDQAVEHLERSSATHERMGARFFEARSRHELAVALGGRAGPGDHAAAITSARHAVALAEAHGYPAVERRARELAAALT